MHKEHLHIRVWLAVRFLARHDYLTFALGLIAEGTLISYVVFKPAALTEDELVVFFGLSLLWFYLILLHAIAQVRAYGPAQGRVAVARTLIGFCRACGIRSPRRLFRKTYLRVGLLCCIAVVAVSTYRGSMLYGDQFSLSGWQGPRAEAAAALEEQHSASLIGRLRSKLNLAELPASSAAVSR